MEPKKSIDVIPRDVSWMYFNYRILQEAQNTSVPLLERLGFMGIYSNNLDEFFRVRMATLTRIAESDVKQMKSQIEEARHTIKSQAHVHADARCRETEFHYHHKRLQRSLQFTEHPPGVCFHPRKQGIILYGHPVTLLFLLSVEVISKLIFLFF